MLLGRRAGGDQVVGRQAHSADRPAGEVRRRGEAGDFYAVAKGLRDLLVQADGEGSHAGGVEGNPLLVVPEQLPSFLRLDRGLIGFRSPLVAVVALGAVVDMQNSQEHSSVRVHIGLSRRLGRTDAGAEIPIVRGAITKKFGYVLLAGGRRRSIRDAYPPTQIRSYPYRPGFPSVEGTSIAPS